MTLADLNTKADGLAAAVQTVQAKIAELQAANDPAAIQSVGDKIDAAVTALTAASQ